MISVEPPCRRILVVEDSPTVAMLCREHLSRAGYDVTVVETGADCLDALEAATPAAMLLDLGLPDMNGIDLLREVKRRDLRTSVVVITSNASLTSAVDAMRCGAFDYIVKPFAGERIVTTVRNAAEKFALSEEVRTYRQQKPRTDFAGMIGSSVAMQSVYRVIESAAASRATVFITGESGTGKELCAHAVHSESPRAKGPFVAINCAAIPRELMESEIFGHMKGAFTNAGADRAGAAMRADGGTLFLDEICEMDLDLQAKILRLTQSGTFERVGASRTESVDIRIVCATNRDPWAEVQAGRFREDLFYRLHVLPLELPALRDRGDDILQLARFFLSTISGQEGAACESFAPDAIARLLSHSWPGNVRELENALHNAVVLNAAEKELSAAMLPRRLGGSGDGAAIGVSPAPARPKTGGDAPTERLSFDSETEVVPMWAVERDAIEHALRLCDGNVPLAAARLQIGVSTIYRKKSEWAKSKAPLGAAD